VSALLSKAQWAESLGVTVKSVERWLAAGLVPDAERQGGRWWIPAGTPRPELDGATSRDVAPIAATNGTSRDVAVSPVVASASLGYAGTLEEASAALGLSVRGLRRLFGDMQAHPGLPFYVGRYGPHGSLRVVVPPRG
jgi:hypothetical protein